MIDLDRIDFERLNGVVTVVTQDAVTGDVLMVAWADREALRLTIETGEMHYTSRKRGLWRKGETSGNVQQLVDLLPDCDGDAVLARVRQTGEACHQSRWSCFGEPGEVGEMLSQLDGIIAQRQTAPGNGYTDRLLADRNLRLKKLGEEVVELVTATAASSPRAAAEEAADLLYHVLVVLRGAGSSLREVREVLAERSGAPRPLT